MIYKHEISCSTNKNPRGDCDCGVAITLLDETRLFLLAGENSTFTDPDFIGQIEGCFGNNPIYDESHREGVEQSIFVSLTKKIGDADIARSILDLIVDNKIPNLHVNYRKA